MIRILPLLVGSETPFRRHYGSGLRAGEKTSTGRAARVGRRCARWMIVARKRLGEIRGGRAADIPAFIAAYCAPSLGPWRLKMKP